MQDSHNILCTICARGGSKGVKNKNIRLLSGKPLIVYTIQQALKWGKAKRLIVSTDSENIAAIAEKYGAEVPFMRPKALATDTAPKMLSIKHAFLESEKYYQEKYDIVADLDPTAPIRSIKDLDNCLDKFIKIRPKVLFSVTKAHKNPYFNMVEQKKGGFVKLCKQRTDRVTRRQDAPLVYSMNASIYFYARDFLKYSKNLMPFTKETAIYVMDDLSGYDIDREIDLKFIEFLLKEEIWKSEV